MEIWQVTELMRVGPYATAGLIAGGFEAKVVLVTGASSGIGLAVARRVASKGGIVVMGARGAQAGEAAAREIHDAVFVAGDLTVSEGAAPSR
jgi:NAD(P)-dependent dehydrogenase (short-subunit alcohol dehydrogenase family)